MTSHDVALRRFGLVLGQVLAGLLGCVLAGGAVPLCGAEFMFQATVDGEPLEGKPLAWNDRNMLLLGRDGRLHEFDPRLARDARKTSPRFNGYSTQETKRALYREFGKRLDITSTQHFVVVHPRGQAGAWAHRFEELYRWCLGYFKVRGFQLAEPEFPLVAIVFRNQADYRRSAQASGTPLVPGMLGHYDSVSNRIFLYDVTDGGESDWSTNAETIIHEATHQTAFNAGIHNRFAQQPRWLVEGLATMFESPGVWNSRSYHSRKNRLHRERLADFRDDAGREREKGTIARLLASDQPFRTDPTAAYAESWALVFYLCETRPRKLADYLERVARRPNFSQYPAVERVSDFQAAFGNDLKQLEANFLGWMADIQ